MKRYKCTAWLTIVVMLAAMLSLPVPASAAGVGDIVMLAAGGNFSLLLKADGTVWAWGDNSNGQLGDGTYTDRHTPTPVRGLAGKTITAIAAGQSFAVALDDTGKAWVWGDNNNGQLGRLNSTMVNSAVPVEIPALTGKTITAITTGGAHMLALANDGTLWAWGENYYGQLGLGYTHGTSGGTYETPKQVPLDTLGGRTVTAISAGMNSTAVLADDGTLWDCGYEYFGLLGRTTATTSEQLLGQVTGVGDVTIEEVAIGEYHMAVRDSNGDLWSWGSNSSGELGETLASGSYSLSPGRVSALEDETIIVVAAGSRNTAVLDDAGTVWTSGRNNYGQLGNGTTSTTGANYFPETSTLTGFSAISTGKTNYMHMLGLKSDGTVWAWGYNSDGQLGDGTTTNSSVPVRVAGLATLSAAEALREDTLDGAQLTVHVDLDSFKDDAGPEQFTLNNAPDGLTVTAAFYSGGDYTLTLGFDRDFDTDIGSLTVNIAASALNGGQAITTSGLSITAIDEPHVTPDQALTERNLDGRTLTVELQTGTFADATLDPVNFMLNNVPPGVSVASVQYTNETTCTVTLAHETADFDSDFTRCTVTIAGSELNDGNPQTTDRFTITAVQESAVVTSNQALERSSLNGSQLLVILQNDTFRDGSLDKANFILNNAPSGLSVGSVFYTGSDRCVVTLSYDGTYFSQDINDFSLTIKAAEMSSKGDASSNSLTITTQPQELSISTDSLPAATVGAAYSETVQAVGGTGAYTWSVVGLPGGLNIHAGSGEIYGTPGSAGSSQVTFTVEDEGGNRVSKILTLQIKLASGTGKYTLSPASDSIYTNGTAADGIATMTVNNGVTGFRYFTVNVTPIETRVGDEVVVFVHLRNGTQLSMNATSADFDSTNRAKAGFNVQASDVIKAYIVDDLTNDQDFNPTLLQ